MGWRHERVRGQQYDDFIDAFVQAVRRKLPNVLLQWEDFAQANAGRMLERYRDQLCTFNDDIQGTAAVTTGTLLAAVILTAEDCRPARGHVRRRVGGLRRQQGLRGHGQVRPAGGRGPLPVLADRPAGSVARGADGPLPFQQRFGGKKVVERRRVETDRQWSWGCGWIAATLTVTGDFNLVLLDKLSRRPEIAARWVLQ